MKKIASIILLVSSMALAQEPAWSEPQSGDKTDAPVKYVQVHSELAKGNLKELDCSKCSAMKDVVFITVLATCGSATCDYFMFKKTNPGFEFVTKVGLGRFQFLKTSHRGYADILNYVSQSADEGDLETMEFDGTAYKVIKTETIKAKVFNKKIKPEHTKEISIVGKIPDKPIKN